MKENKTLAQLYQTSSHHKFGDITLIIENIGGKLRGKFIFHQIAADRANLGQYLRNKGLSECFGNPPALIDSNVLSSVIWDESYRTLGDIIPKVENDIQKFSKVIAELGPQLTLCAECPVFERCYRIAEFHLQRKQANATLHGKGQL